MKIIKPIKLLVRKKSKTITTVYLTTSDQLARFSIAVRNDHFKLAEEMPPNDRSRYSPDGYISESGKRYERVSIITKISPLNHSAITWFWVPFPANKGLLMDVLCHRSFPVPERSKHLVIVTKSERYWEGYLYGVFTSAKDAQARLACVLRDKMALTRDFDVGCIDGYRCRVYFPSLVVPQPDYEDDGVIPL